jgi:hypothetical protein
MSKGGWIPLFFGVFAVVVAIFVANAVAVGNWPAGQYNADMLKSGATVAGALFVIAVFLERAMAVINDILFGAETVDLEHKARMQLVTESPDLLATEFEQKLLDEKKQRMRLAGSFLAAVLIAAAGARSLGSLFTLQPGTIDGKPGILPAQQNLFLVMDVLLTAGVLAGGSSAIAAIIDLLRNRATVAKAQQETEKKAQWLGIMPSAIQARYKRAGFAVNEIEPAPQYRAIVPRLAVSDVNEADDAAANREWRATNPKYAEMVLTTVAKDWRTAKALEKLRNQLNAAFPNRSKANDGTIGDEAHCGTNPSSSDHCANILDGSKWVVTAFDATHDPTHACDMNLVTQKVVDSRDSRIKYIIWNKRICASYEVGNAAAWQWRNYSGANPHDKHAHFSVLADKESYDNETDWTIG